MVCEIGMFKEQISKKVISGELMRKYFNCGLIREWEDCSTFADS